MQDPCNFDVISAQKAGLEKVRQYHSHVLFGPHQLAKLVWRRFLQPHFENFFGHFQDDYQPSTPHPTSHSAIKS